LTKELDEHRSDLEDIVKKRTAELQQEITERKRAEEILKDNQKFLDSIIEQSPYPTWISDTKGTMVRANPALKKALNLSDKQLIGKYNVFEDKQIEADILLILRDALEKGKTTDYELDWVGDQSGIDSMEKGNRVYCEGTMFPVYNQKGTITHAVITYKDVSDRKRTEEALVKSELLFSQMFEQSMTSTCIYNPEGTIIGANNEFCKMFGVDERTILNSGYNVFKDQNVIDAEILPLLKEIFENKKTNNWEIDFNIDKASESTQTSTSRVGKIFLEVFGYPVLNNKNIIEYVVLQHYDITDRKLAEKSIQKNQYYLTKAQEIGKIGTWELDIQKNNLIWTDEIYKIFDVPLGNELTYEIFLNFVHPDDRDYINRKWNEALNNEPYDIMHRLIVNNKVKWVREKADIEFDAGGRPLRAIGFTQDLTDLKQIEDALKESEQRFKKMFDRAPLSYQSLDWVGDQSVNIISVIWMKKAIL